MSRPSREAETFTLQLVNSPHLQHSSIPMPYRSSQQRISMKMITIFVVLGIVLLAVPIVVALFMLFAKMKRRQRADTIKNSTTIRTTVQQGPNGRTMFQSTASRASPPRHQQRTNPVLPLTQQQAAGNQKQQSMKKTWQRLSRPFSMMPQPRGDEDQIELTQKHMPAPYNQTKYEGPVSPVTPREYNRSGSSSTWNTVDNLDSDPISPLSVTNMQATSSVAGGAIRGQTQRQQPPPNDSFQNVPLIPPTDSRSIKQQPQPKQSIRGSDLGSSQGFAPPSNMHSKQESKQSVKQQGKDIAKQAIGTAGQYVAGQIKQNVLDANKHKVNKIQLSQPPKAKTSKGKGWI